MDEGVRAIESWLERFAAAVRARDYDAGRALFDRTVVAFGTVAERVDDLDALAERQWRHVWPVTSGFEFDYATARCRLAGDLAFAAVTWSSNERDPAGRPRARIGRATLVLRRVEDGWLAVHSHFSLRPPGAAPA